MEYEQVVSGAHGQEQKWKGYIELGGVEGGSGLGTKAENNEGQRCG